MKKTLAALVLSVVACGEPSTDVDDIEVESKEEALWCFGFPYKVMGFPSNQGSWKGDAAGQNMYPIFGNTGPTCPPAGYELSYFQDDGQINLTLNVGWAPNTCWTAAQGTVVCNGQVFQCPANACLTTPAAWQEFANTPLVWGWQNPNYSASPGNHGIWPKFGQTCTTAAPTIQFNPNGSGGTLLSCNYPMGAFVLRQF